MGRSDVMGADLLDVLVRRGLRGLCMTVAGIADNFAIDKDMPPFLFLDPAAAARDVLLPANADSVGLVFVLFNTSDNATSAETITLKTSADAALVPPVDILKSEAAVIVNDGNGWRALVGANT